MRPTVVVPRKDLRREVFRSSGPGGQSVNKTSSAVRWVHVPTGISAACRSERSQPTNSKIAYENLMEKLVAFAMVRRGARPRRGPATFGYWKRCYRLCGSPQDVQDVETETVAPDARSVLSGKIDPFIAAAMRKSLAERAAWVEEAE